MPQLSFQGEWLDKLLSGSKQQTTRKQTDRIKVGDICTIYNQQQRRIADKPLRRLTVDGIAAMSMNRYPFPKPKMYYAHRLGKVRITEVYDILPIQCYCGEDAWAKADGFDSFSEAMRWFETRYGARWMAQTWTVIKWQGWQECYMEAF